MGKRYQVILLILLVIGGIFGYGQTVQAEDTIAWPVEINAANFPDDEFRDYLLGEDFGADDKLTEAEIQEIKEIDVSGMSYITSLKGIEFFQNLETLFCVMTRITELDISKNLNLQSLICNETEISELDVRNNTNLNNLDCVMTRITKLDVSKNPNLQYLYCTSTKISELDVRNNPNLNNLDCANTKISELDVRNNPNLQYLYCTNTKISELDVSKNPNLQRLICTNTEISELDVRNNTNLDHLNCVNTKISELDVRNNTNLDHLNCANTKISELDVSKNPNLQTLYCNNTKISELDVSKNPNLQRLICNNTEISKLDVRNNPNLNNLDCANTKISELDVSKNANLKYLSCNNRKISELDVSNNTNLQYLYCYNTEISELDVSKNTNLKYLCCNNTEISELDVSKNKQLKMLNCRSTRISNLDLSMTILVQAGEDKTSDFSNCKTPVLLSSKNMIDLSQLPGFNTSKIVDGTIENAMLSGDKLKVDEPSKVVSYSYDCGKNIKETFTLEISSYEISYDANGGLGKMESDKVPIDRTAVTLPENGFTAPTGKKFKEWAVGSTGGAKVKPGEPYTFTGATTVYAVWETIPETVQDVKKATFKELQLKAKASKTSNKLSWKKVKGADGYIVYGAKRGKKLTEIKASTKGVSYTHKKLSKKTFYQYQVKAYCLVNGEKKVISVSKNIYSVTTGGRYDNAKRLTVKASKLTLIKGKTKTIQAKITTTKGKKLKNYTKAFRYETSNSKVATVSAKGKIKARRKGKCTIYVYTQNGLSKSIRVTVK